MEPDPVVYKAFDEEIAELAIIHQEMVLANEETGSANDPKTFLAEAWHHPDPIEREHWRTAIRKEFHDMIRNGVWRKT